MKKFVGAVMWVLAQVFNPQEDIKTKTIKKPEEAASACISENSSELDSSATQSSAVIDNGNSTSSGKKQEKQFDLQTRYPWMICEPNEKEGKLFAHCLLFIRCSREQARSLLNEIMQAGNLTQTRKRGGDCGVHKNLQTPLLLQGKSFPSSFLRINSGFRNREINLCF